MLVNNHTNFLRTFLTTSTFKRIGLSLLLTAVALYSMIYIGSLLIEEKNLQHIDNSLLQAAELLQSNSLNADHTKVLHPKNFTDQAANHTNNGHLFFRSRDSDRNGLYFLDIPDTVENPTEAQKNKTSQWRLLTFKYSDGNFYTLGYPVHQFDNLFAFAYLATTLLILLLSSIALLTAFKHSRQLNTIRSTVQGFSRGDITRRVPIFNTGSDLNKLGNSLNSILNRSEYLMTNSRQIINNISHDLRKPLTRIKNRLELLQFETTDNYQVAELDRSIQDADNLLKTFNDLLSISQAETGMHRDAFEKVSLKAICEDMIEMYEPIAEEKGVDIKLVVDNPFTVIGNKQLLTQLISNLIDNACKYASGEDGQLIIFAESTLHHTTLRFADNGPGIPLELREKVLERFVRLDAARTAEGNGLGLSLAKAVMELHQGELVLGRTSKNDNQPGLLVKLVFPKVEQSSNKSNRLKLGE